MLEKRPGAAAEIEAAAIVPIDRHANSTRACDVIRRTGDEQRACRVHSQRIEGESIRLGAWLVRARRLGGSDDVKWNTDLGRSPTTDLVRAVGDDADLHCRAQSGQDGRSFWPGSELTQARNQRRREIRRKPDSRRSLGHKVVMRPIVTRRIAKAAVLASPPTPERCAAGDFIVGRLRVKERAKEVEQHSVVRRHALSYSVPRRA